MGGFTCEPKCDERELVSLPGLFLKRIVTVCSWEGAESPMRMVRLVMVVVVCYSDE